MAQIPRGMVVYVDETGIDEYLYRPYGRAAKGVPVLAKISGKKYKRTGIVAAQKDGKILADFQFEGTMCGDLFGFWFAELLLPQLNPGDVIVMDNASFHQKDKLTKLAADANCRILFLPPYSPDLNLIEQFWHWLKERLRRILPNFASFDSALSD
jgi:hypothetical protein